MKNYLKFVILLLPLFANNIVNGQVNYTIVAKSGLSNCHCINRAYVYDEYGYVDKSRRDMNDATNYSYSKMFSIEANIVEQIKKTKFFLEQGIGYESKFFYISSNNVSKTEHNYTAITIPLKVKYNLNNTFTVFGGVNNIFKVKSTELFESDKKYNLRGLVGIDAIFCERYIVGCGYAYDITHFTKMNDFDIFYHFDVISFSLGIVF